MPKDKNTVENILINGTVYTIKRGDLFGNEAFVVMKRNAGHGRYKSERVGYYESENSCYKAIVNDLRES